LAVHVVVDSDAAKEEVGDLKNTLSNGLIREENIIHLADLVTGRHRLDRERTTAFKSVGMALYDLYAASVFLDEALKRNLGIELPS
jgi:ornithine cyclodeaminase/alanine dehydrogenase-like protein (mu-crystallin family)